MRSFIRPWRGLQLSQYQTVPGHRVLRWDVQDNSAGSLWMRDRVSDWWQDLSGRSVVIAARDTGAERPFHPLMDDWDARGEAVQAQVEGVEFYLTLDTAHEVQANAALVEVDLRLQLARIITSIGRVMWVSLHGLTYSPDVQPVSRIRYAGVTHKLRLQRQLVRSTTSEVLSLYNLEAVTSWQRRKRDRYKLVIDPIISRSGASNSLPLLVPNRGVAWASRVSSLAGSSPAGRRKIVRVSRSPQRLSIHPTSAVLVTSGSEIQYMTFSVPVLDGRTLYLYRTGTVLTYEPSSPRGALVTTAPVVLAVRSGRLLTRTQPALRVFPARLSRLLQPDDLVLAQYSSRKELRPLSHSFAL